MVKLNDLEWLITVIKVYLVAQILLWCYGGPNCSIVTVALMDDAGIAINLEETWRALYLASIPWIDASKNHLQILAYDLSLSQALSISFAINRRHGTGGVATSYST